MTPTDRAQVEQDLLARMQPFTGLSGRWCMVFASPADSGTQYRHEVNAFLRVQLGALDSSTIDARLCLEDDTDYKRWLQLLERHVFPLLVVNNLPVGYKELAKWANQGSYV